MIKMNFFNKMLRMVVLAGALSGCGDSKPEYLEGTVMKECGKLSGTGSFLFKGWTSHGNMGEEDYSLAVQTDNEQYNIDVKSSPFSRALESLAEEIRVGTKIRFKTNPYGIPRFQRYKSTREMCGNITIDEISVLKR